MKKHLLLAGVLVLIAGVTGIFLHAPGQDIPASPPKGETATQRPQPVTRPPDSSIPLAALSDTNIPPEKRVRRVYEMLQNFIMATKSRGGPPLSTNGEITRALTGRNKLSVMFLPPDHPAISTSGELLDPWETPYFFHALAADSWEVVSAGPDRTHFNDDDIIFPPARNPNSLRRSSQP
ncbi:MAG: hypothetical protein WEB60_09515 [Terrimicrobiaceae bacterium]